MRVLLTAFAATLAFAAPAAAQSPNLVINEIDYDQVSTDTAEFVEIRNNATTPVNLGTYALRFVNGANNTIYRTVALPSVDLAAGDYYVVCATPANVPGCDLDAGDDGFVQNGDPDAVAIVIGDAIVDTVSYGGVTPGYTEGPTGAPTDTTTVPQSIGRSPNGCDTDQNAVDFRRLPPATPGTSNGGTSCGGPPADAAPSVTDTDPDSGATQVPLDADVSITFSEAVTLTGDPVSIECTTSGAHPATQGGGPRTYTFDPASDFVRNETCTVRVSAAGVSDEDADDPPDTMAADHTFSSSTLGLAMLRIHDIQGAQHLSPYDDDFVAGVPGVVTAIASNGFWFQDPQPDGDERTSEGMFVFTGSRPTVTIGQALAVDGQVQEFRGGGEASDNLTITEIVGPTWTPTRAWSGRGPGAGRCTCSPARTQPGCCR